jgi:hypothetical protein
MTYSVKTKHGTKKISEVPDQGTVPEGPRDLVSDHHSSTAPVTIGIVGWMGILAVTAAVLAGAVILM